MCTTGSNPQSIVAEKGLKQVKDEGTIETAVDQVLTENAQEVELYKAGKEKLFGFFVGQVMKKTKGKANPQLVNEIITKKLRDNR